MVTSPVGPDAAVRLALERSPDVGPAGKDAEAGVQSAESARPPMTISALPSADTRRSNTWGGGRGRDAP